MAAKRAYQHRISAAEVLVRPALKQAKTLYYSTPRSSNLQLKRKHYKKFCLRHWSTSAVYLLLVRFPSALCLVPQLGLRIQNRWSRC